MKVISPGVVALSPIRIEISTVTGDMVHWWAMQGAEVVGKDESYHDSRGRWVKAQRAYIRMPGYKWCHYHANGTDQVTMHLREQDAPTASLFCLKFYENILSHNIKVPEHDTETISQ